MIHLMWWTVSNMGQGNIKAIKGIWIPTYIDTFTKPLYTTTKV